MKWYMAIGNRGTVLHNLRYPRRDILQRMYRNHAEKIWCDRPDGTRQHVGYIVASEWFTVYEVTEWHS